MFYSIIIPVYNRPQEVEELLISLRAQTYTQFEVLIVEDGSQVKADTVVERFQSDLNIRYFYKPNSGPGDTRNYGMARAEGAYMLIFDSDCILPPHYLETVHTQIRAQELDAYGGPDRAEADFSPKQLAMNYAMTSLLTTGGIRGGRAHVGRFLPRSFNMGFSRKVYERTKGFTMSALGGEDLDMSLRILKDGFRVALIPEAWVYHKRKTTFRKFFRQLGIFGRARIKVFLRHPEQLKLVHLFPSLLLIYTLSCIPAGLLGFRYQPSVAWIYITPLLVYVFSIWLDATWRNRSLGIGLMSVYASMGMLFSYGWGLIRELTANLGSVLYTWRTQRSRVEGYQQYSGKTY